MITFLALLLAAAPDLGAVKSLSVVPVADRTEITIGIDGPVGVEDFLLDGPARLVLDFSGARHALPAEQFTGINRGGVLGVRTSQYRSDVVRVVLELEHAVEYEVSRDDGAVRITFRNGAGEFAAWRSGPASEPAAAERPALDAGSARRTSSPAPVPQAAPQEPEQPRITVSFDDAPLIDVIATFAAFSGRSIVAGQNVTGNVTADINNQPWQLALEAILEAHGYALLERAGGIMQVLQLTDLRQRETIEEQVTRQFRINYVSVDSIRPAIEGLLSERGRVTTSPSTNTLILTDARSIVERVSPLIAELDARTPQVTIAAKIIFVDRTALEELGLVYDLKDSRGSQFNRIVQGFRDVDGDGILEPDEGTSQDVILLSGNSIAALANANARVASPTLQVATTLLLGRHSLITFIDALESLQLSDIQAAPVVTVLDNRQARIQVGEETPVRIIDAGAGGAGGGGGEGGQGGFPRATVQFKETGVILEVTPHVTGNQVLLELHAERSNVGTAPSDIGVTFQTQESDTQVLVNDGETIVIGGLTIIEKSKSISGIPFLMDLPILGRLFSTTQEREVKRDLLIMVTPHIIREGT